MPASKIKYIDSEGNVQTYIGNPRYFKKSKKKVEPKEIKKPYTNKYKKKKT